MCVLRSEQAVPRRLPPSPPLSAPRPRAADAVPSSCVVVTVCVGVGGCGSKLERGARHQACVVASYVDDRRASSSLAFQLHTHNRPAAPEAPAQAQGDAGRDPRQPHGHAQGRGRRRSAVEPRRGPTGTESCRGATRPDPLRLLLVDDREREQRPALAWAISNASQRLERPPREGVQGPSRSTRGRKSVGGDRIQAWTMPWSAGAPYAPRPRPAPPRGGALGLVSATRTKPRHQAVEMRTYMSSCCCP